MNSLPMSTSASQIARPTAPALSPELQQLLDSDGSPDNAAAAIVASPVLKSEAQAALPALKAVAEFKAGEEGVYAIISRRFGTLQKPNLTEEGWRNWWADYYDACADLPLAALEAGMRAWVNNPDAEFVPKPGKLRHLAETAVSLTLRRYQRARRALQLADEGARAREPDPQQAETVRKLMADFSKKSLACAKAIPLRPRRADLPNTAGKPDAGGLTPEMRAVLARQSESDQ